MKCDSKKVMGVTPKNAFYINFNGQFHKCGIEAYRYCSSGLSTAVTLVAPLPPLNYYHPAAPQCRVPPISTLDTM